MKRSVAVWVGSVAIALATLTLEAQSADPPGFAMWTDAKTTGVGEIRGTAIQGGVVKKIGPGDIVLIPAKMAHHLATEPGKDMTYFLMKLDAKDAK